MPERSLLPDRDSSSTSDSHSSSSSDIDAEVKVKLLSATSEDDNLGYSYSDVTNIPKTSQRPHPKFVRHFSVQSGKHAFDVTNYGPESIDQSPKTAVRQPTLARTRHISEPSSPFTKDLPVTFLDTVLDISDDCEDVTIPQKLAKSVQILIDETDTPTAGTEAKVIRSVNNKPWFDRGILDIAKRGRAFAKRKKDRLFDKNGESRVMYSKVKKRGIQFLIDFFTTMLELQWKYHFLMFVLAFGLSWVLFALVWWGITAADLHANRLKTGRNETVGEFVPCVIGVTDFPTALLYSIETQHTIGYGTRALTPYCPFATAILMIQSMFGVILQCILTGIIFAKMARPKSRAQTIIFSKYAVICNRDGQRYFMFRVGDMRQTQILGAKIEVMLSRRKVTKEGEYLPIVTQELPVTTESGSDFIFLAWPIVIMHKIDRKSPIWNVSASDILEKDWELIAVLEGTDEVTGSSFQVRTSYLPSEILWGHTLKSLLSKTKGGIYKIDYTHFHDTDPLIISEMSARRESKFISSLQNMHTEDTETSVFDNDLKNGYV